eukprot:1347424-Rhodomonas_salina.1
MARSRCTTERVHRRRPATLALRRDVCESRSLTVQSPDALKRAIVSRHPAVGSKEAVAVELGALIEGDDLHQHLG